MTLKSMKAIWCADMISIHEKVQEKIDVSIELSDKVNLLLGDSVLLNMFVLPLIEEKYKVNHKVSYCSVNTSWKDIVKSAENSDILLLENADLYMSEEKYKALSSYKSVVVASIKEYNYSVIKDMGRYLVENTKVTEVVSKRVDIK